ncbi:MAG: ATP-binding protein [Nitrospirota bacterium]|nr:ATP-binding protein [Nitrospirota bacterium]
MRFSLSIRKKILLAAILVGLIPGILSFYLIYHFGTAIMRDKQGEDFKEITKGAAREISLIIDKEIDEAYHLALSPMIADAIEDASRKNSNTSQAHVRGIKELDAAWQDISADNPVIRAIVDQPAASYLRATHIKEEYINLTILNSKGVAIGAMKKPRRLFWGEDPMWIGGMRQPAYQAFVSDVISTGPDSYGIEIAVPIVRKNGKAIGVLVVTLSLNELFAAINSIQIGQTGHANMVRSDGMMLIDPLIPPMSLKVDKKLMELISHDKPGWTIADDEHGGINAIMGYAPVVSSMVGEGSFGGHRWYVFLGLEPNESYAPVRKLMGRLAFLGLLFIGLVSTFAYLVAQRIIQPIESLKVGAEMIGQGKLDYRLNINTGDEIEALAKDFNSMAEKLLESRRTLMEWNSQLEEEIKRRTYDLRIANEELRRADRMKSEFLTNMSHELRTPLNSIIGFSEVLTDNLYGDLNEKQQRYVSHIHMSGKHLLQLINDILDLSKVEAGKMELHYTTASIADFFETTLNSFRTQAHQKQIAITSTVEGVDQVTADLTRLKQILFNLVSNAVKFTPEHGKITISARPVGAFVEIAVSDTGIGIRKEDQHLIFQEFRQLDASFTRKYEGTGLGLALTKKLVELHGGKIWVESEESQGSTFFIMLPNREKTTKESHAS